MFRLTREVRFAINPAEGDNAADPAPANGFAGYPPLDGLGRFYSLRVTLAGPLDPHSSYLRNIRDIDRVVRDRATDLVRQAIDNKHENDIARALFAALQHAWPSATLDSLSLGLSPFLWLSQLAGEFPMTQRLSQLFEFCAAHRLHNPQLSDEQNRRLFGKCNNPNWHGHNYQLQVTVAGKADPITGFLTSLGDLERTVNQTVVERLDHRNLNSEVPEFRDTNPTVENIARVIYQLLKPTLGAGGTRLASVTVWESPRTWCEYSED